MNTPASPLIASRPGLDRPAAIASGPMHVPSIRFDLGDTSRSFPPFAVDAADLPAVATLGLDPECYVRLVGAFVDVLRTPEDSSDAVALREFRAAAGLQSSAKTSLSNALHTFTEITVAVVANGATLGFSIGTTVTGLDPRIRLAGLEGRTEVGEIGPWPQAQAAH